MLPFLAVMVVLAGGAFDAEASTKQLSVTVQVGYGNTIKLSQWMPVIVNITNSGPPLDGTLEIKAPNSFSGKGGPPGGSTAVYETPISLATGSTKHFRSYVLEDQPGAISIQVVQNGRVVDSEQASVAAAPSGLLAAVVSDQPSTLDSLAGIHPGGPGPSVVHLAGPDLPDSGLLLRAFDLVAIDDFSTDTLTTAQRNALVDYAMSGGSILIGTGGSWHKTVASLPSSILPMQLTGSLALGQSTALGGLTGVEVATGTLAGATTWLSEGDKPLIVEKPVGQGYVSLATFDWNQDLITGWSGTPALLRQVFVRSVLGLGASQNIGGLGGSAVNSVSAKGGTISQALGSLPSLNLPAWWLVGALIVAYVLLVGPINYFVLRKINRRALAWLTVPAIVIVTSAGAYGTSVLTKGRSAQANQVSIIHTIPGWDRAYAEVYTGIFTPTRGDFNVSISGAPTLVSPIYNFNGAFPGTSQPGVQVDTTTGSITLPGMTAFTMRGFATEDFTAAPAMEVDAHVLNGLLVGTVKNLSATSYTDGVVIAGNSFQKFGRLAPGTAVNFSFAPTVASPFNGMPAFMTIYPNSLYGQGAPSANMSDGEREAEAKTAILSTLPINGSSGITASAMPMVVAWSRQSSEVITIDGSRPRSYAESGVVTTVPVSQIGRGALPAGVVAARLVDMEGDMQAQGGPPGLTILQSGSVTYDLAPQLAPGTHLDSVSISSSNQFGGKGVIPPGSSGGPGTINSQVWDWSQGAWVDLAYKDGGNTSVPQGAVNPSTGEVRLKLRSDGPFSTGWLSLAGTVS
ncbi:MAG: hypothetical protein ABI334_04885 [Candidatus Dormiibacterota bacterium]